MNYKKEIEKSLEYFSKDFILDYSFTLNEDLIDKYYIFCRGCLDNFSEKIDITPNIVIFNTNMSVNAKAKKDLDGTSIITINQGLLNNCITNYLKNEKLLEYINTKFNYTSNSLDTNVNLLAFQVTTQFTFYHELGHLIQLTKLNREFELEERQEENQEYNPVQHKLEINADTFASIAISTHIQQYCERNFGESLNSINFEETIMIFSVCLFNYFNSFLSASKDIYYKENKHPHPYFRVLLITMNIANHFNNSEFLKSKNINVNYIDTFRKIIDFNEELEKNGIFDTDFYNKFDNSIENKEKVIIFLYELIEFDCNEYYDAMDGWVE